MNIDPLKKIEKTKSSESKKSSASVSANKLLFERLMASQGIDSVNEIEQQDDEFEALQDLHKQFVASVNHEINNPLCVVRGMAELIKDDNLTEVKKRIMADSDQISGEIRDFTNRDIVDVGKGCKNSPLNEITFRQDLVGCYLHKVIGAFTAKVSHYLDDMERILQIDAEQTALNSPEFDRVKNTLKTIRKHAERIREIIVKLEELLPDDIETTDYLHELKMVHLRDDNPHI